MSTKNTTTLTTPLKIQVWRNRNLTGPSRALKLIPEDRIVLRGEEAVHKGTGEIGMLGHIYRGKSHYYYFHTL